MGKVGPGLGHQPRIGGMAKGENDEKTKGWSRKDEEMKICDLLNTL